MKIKAFVVSVLLICAFALSGCSNPASKLVGSWELVSGDTDVSSITFYSDGKCLVADSEMGRWSIADGTLKVLGPFGGYFFFLDNLIGKYEIAGDKLTMPNARIGGSYTDTLVYERVK